MVWLYLHIILTSWMARRSTNLIIFILIISIYFLPKSLKSLYSVWFNNVFIRFLIFSFHMKVHFNTYFVICALKYKDRYFLIEEHNYYMFLAWPTFIFENLFIKITLLWFSELVMWNKEKWQEIAILWLIINIYLITKLTEIYFSYIVRLYPQFLIHTSQNPENFLCWKW